MYMYIYIYIYKWIKKWVVFRLPFAPNIKQGGNFKGGVHAIWGFSDLAHTIWWVVETFPLL